MGVGAKADEGDRLGAVKGFLLWLAATIAAVVLARELRSADLVSPAAPCGVISLQLARSPERVEEILDEWRSLEAEGRARKSIHLDFAFIAAYAVALFLTVLWCSKQVAVVGSKGLRALAWLQLGAGGLDAGENVGLLLYLEGHVTDRLVSIVSTLATAKFAIIGAGALAFLITFVMWLSLPWFLYRRLASSRGTR